MILHQSDVTASNLLTLILGSYISLLWPDEDAATDHRPTFSYSRLTKRQIVSHCLLESGSRTAFNEYPIVW